MTRAAIALAAALALAGVARAQAPPIAPPTAVAPAPATGSTVSPLLTQPGPVSTVPSRAMPSYPAQGPGPIDEQKGQSYRNELSNQLRQLDNEGVSPGTEQYRELRQRLHPPGGR